MSVVKHFIEDSIKKKEIDEFLQSEFERAGYGGVSITKTPLGTHLVIYTMRPGLVIGRGGETIRALATVLEEKFQLPSPQISVAEIEIPELNAYVVASKIASALKRGIHYRRAGFWGITQAMEAGALGIEIVISGKLRTDRARYEKFRDGYLPKSGEPARRYMRKAELDVQLKPGTLGVRVSLLPPDAQFPDKVQVYVIEEESEPKPEREIVEETAVTEKSVVETEISTVEEPISEPAVPPAEAKTEELKVTAAETKIKLEKKVEQKVVEKPSEEKVVSKEKVPKKKSVKTKAATEKKVVKAKPIPVKKKPVVEKKVEQKVVEKPSEEKVVSKEKVPKKKSVKTKAVNVEKKTAVERKVAEKVAESMVVPAKEEKGAKTEAPTTEEQKEAGE